LIVLEVAVICEFIYTYQLPVGAMFVFFGIIGWFTWNRFLLVLVPFFFYILYCSI